jgi:CubicO group peptidase (beta-lactamase class C family)
MISRVIASLMLALVPAGASFAQNVDPRMDQIVQSYVSNKQFMGSVLVARGNDVVFSKGYGSANLEWDVPDTPSTKFRIGSVTKQFTAASILLLEERGKLNVEDTVKKYLPDAPAAWDKITLFHLLTHTAGIPNVPGSPDQQSLGFRTTADNVARFRDKPLDFAPGEKWNYSNNGYILLGYLIERISGQSYEKFLQENIFSPLGMKDSGYESNAAVTARRAAGYAPGPDGPVNAAFIHMSVPHAAGALYSTTEDLWRWEQGLFGGKLLSAASLQKMTAPFKNEYAFGLQVHTVNGRKVIDHSGSIQGFNTMLAYYPEDKLTVVALGNLNGPGPAQIAGRLAAVAHGETVTLQNERQEIAVDLKVLGGYVGVYQMAPGTNMVITLDNNQLSSKLGNQAPVLIFPESQTRFFAKAVDAQLEFSGNDAQGRATQFTLHQNGRDITAKRLDDAESKRITDAAAALAKRVKDQTAMPGSEAAARRMIEELRSGQPNYDLMSPGLAATTRQQLSQLQSAVKQRGAVQSITFKGVGPAGADIYDVKFENGSWEYRIMLGPDGKVETAAVRPGN